MTGTIYWNLRTADYRKTTVEPTEAHPRRSILLNPMTRAIITAPNGKNFKTFVLLDTGADTCCFPLTYALMLGLDVLSMPKEEAGGLGSVANLVHYAELTIDLGRGVVFTANVGFTEGMNFHGMGLLGQDGFFSNYDVSFSHRASTFTISVP
jgi:hypothetical protein